MKVSQSFVVVSLSVAAQTQVSMASPVPEAGEMSFDSPQFSEAVLEDVMPTRLVPKGFGKRMHPSLQSLAPRGRAVSLSGLSVTGRGVPRGTHTPTDRSKLHAAILLPDHPSSTNILNASLGAHRPIRPLDKADYHGLRSDPPLLDLSVKVRRRADSAASKLPSVVQVASGDVSKPVTATLSALPVVVEDLSLGKQVLPETPGVGILGARDVSPSWLGGLPLLRDLGSSLPASASPTTLASSGIPVLGSLLVARSEQPEASLDGLGGLSQPQNPFSSESLSASAILAAGGAFPIQPSHSLDGQTLPNEASVPDMSQLLADAALIRGSDIRATTPHDHASAKKKHHPSSALEHTLSAPEDDASLLPADAPLASPSDEALSSLPGGVAKPQKHGPATVLDARALPVGDLGQALPSLAATPGGATTEPLLGPLLRELPVLETLLKARADGPVSVLEGSGPRAVTEPSGGAISTASDAPVSHPYSALSAAQLPTSALPDPPLSVEPTVVPNFSQLLAAAAAAAPPEETLRATTLLPPHHHSSLLPLDPKLLRTRALFSFPSTSS